MPLPALAIAALLAAGLGLVLAARLRAGGLVVVTLALAAAFVLRWLAGYAQPSLVVAAGLLGLMQAGYLLGTLTPLADRLHRRPRQPEPPEPAPQPEPGPDSGD